MKVLDNWLESDDHIRSGPLLRVAQIGKMHPRDLLLEELLHSTMSAKGQLRRFENKAQLLRHISEETGTDIDTLWDEYEAQVE